MLPEYRVIGGTGPPGWGPNAQKDLIQSEICGVFQHKLVLAAVWV